MAGPQVVCCSPEYGGGGGGYGQDGGAGGSGIVILRFLTSGNSYSTTGSPTVTTDGSHTVVKYLEQILRGLNNRTFLIKNMIEWKKFTSGAI